MLRGRQDSCVWTPAASAHALFAHMRTHAPLPPFPQVLKQLADAQAELQEAIAEAGEAAEQQGEQDGDEAASEGSDVGFGFAQEAFTPAQLAVARRAAALLAAVGGMVRAVAKLLLAER